MKIYLGSCAVTQEKISSVLQAAHICQYKGSKSNHLQNGIILRSDIHLLFDNYLITIDSENYAVVLSTSLWGSNYSTLAGKKILLPADPRYMPSKKALKLHNIGFEKRQVEK